MKTETARLAVRDIRKKKHWVVHILLPNGFMMAYSCKLIIIIMHFNKQKAT